MKYIILGVAALLMLGGCVGEPRPMPKPKPVVKEEPKPKPKPKPVRAKRHKKGVVPPLPKREVDVDLDNIVDQAAAEVLNEDNVVQKMP
jgi:outer membrane biosynthesis protein TonB